MAWIQKPERKKSVTRNEHTPTRDLRAKAYNTTAWRSARMNHLTRHPVCEQCLREGKVYAGAAGDPLQVHHIKSPFKDGKVDRELFFDDNNLMTICSACHGKIHADRKANPTDVIRQLDELLNDGKAGN